MLKTLGKQIKEFKAASIATPLFMLLEVLMETLVPFLMASIIDDGVNVPGGDIHHICVVGAWMIVAAAVGLFATYGRSLRCVCICRVREESAAGDVL